LGESIDVGGKQVGEDFEEELFWESGKGGHGCGFD
jgi:hypothetical protein